MRLGGDLTGMRLAVAVRLMLASLLILPALSARPLRWSEQQVESSRQMTEEDATVCTVDERTQRRRRNWTTTRVESTLFSTQSLRRQLPPAMQAVGHRWANGLNAPLRC